MKTRSLFIRISAYAFLFAFIMLFLLPDIAEARGGSFGGRSFGRSFGSRGGRSFGGSRSFSRPKSTPTKPQRSFSKPSSPNYKPQAKTSFGGQRLSSSQAYTSKYGVPRKTSTFTGRNPQGMQQNYVVHSYGGFSSGLMTGYLMGNTSWMWMMPFHPAFYYGRPYYVQNPDGTMEVYPPTFQLGRLLFTLFIVAVIAWIIYRVIKRKRSRLYSQSSFS